MALIDYDNNKHRISDGEQFYCPLLLYSKASNEQAKISLLITDTLGR